MFKILSCARSAYLCSACIWKKKIAQYHALAQGNVQWFVTLKDSDFVAHFYLCYILLFCRSAFEEFFSTLRRLKFHWAPHIWVVVDATLHIATKSRILIRVIFNNIWFYRLEQELDSARDEIAALHNMTSSLRMERDQLEKEIQHLHMEYPTMFGSPLHSERRDESEQTDPSQFYSDPSGYNDFVKEHELNSRLQVTEWKCYDII